MPLTGLVAGVGALCTLRQPAETVIKLLVSVIEAVYRISDSTHKLGLADRD